MIINTITDNIENKIDNLWLQEWFLKNRSFMKLAISLENLYQTITGTSGLYYIEDLKSDSHILYILYIYIYIYIYIFASMRALQKWLNMLFILS